ncbi:MAG: penicillin-binding protein activator LpoB [Bacteroides sp.]|nr:penicillin-binding protein activator LpoB [Treponema brennaborense]MCM1469420.1 penicillin-binding protein activator LpoB [Bacteroides sp.]
MLFAFALSAVFCLPTFCAEYYTKSSVSGKRFAVFEPALRGVESGDAAWLPTAVAEPLRTNFKLYMGVVLIDISNTESVRQIQRKQESGAFDQKTAVEAGRLLNAQFAVFPTITKTKNTYQLSCAVTDLQTGERVASATVSEVARVNDLYG